MKSIIFFISVLIFSQSSAIYAQQKRESIGVDAEFNRLLHYKRQYEEYQSISKINPSYTIKRDSVYELYVNQIKSIRNAPEIYLSYINKAIENKKVEYDGPERVLYNYVNTALPFNPDLHFINRLELYKIIKEYIYEKSGALLPEKTEAYLKAGGDNGGYKVTF